MGFCLIVSNSANRCKHYIESLGLGGYTVATFTLGVCRAINCQICVVGGVIVTCIYFWWFGLPITTSSP